MTQDQFEKLNRNAALIGLVLLVVMVLLFAICAHQGHAAEFHEAGQVALQILPQQDKTERWLRPYTAGANGFKLVSGPWPPGQGCEGVWKWGYEVEDGHRHLIAKCGDTVLEMNNFMF